MRDRGTFNFSASLEPKKLGPLDARTRVNTYAELLLEDTWKDTDNNLWIFNGMLVSVLDRPGKLYELIDQANYSQAEAWKEIGGELVIVEISSILDSLDETSTSDQIFNAFGGKPEFIKLVKLMNNKMVIPIMYELIENNGRVAAVCNVQNSSYIDDNTCTLMLAWNSGIISYVLAIYVENGLATAQKQIKTPVTEAPNDGNIYGQRNNYWERTVQRSEVLTTDGSNSFTPTLGNQPANKTYVDNTVNTAVAPKANSSEVYKKDDVYTKFLLDTKYGGGIKTVNVTNWDLLLNNNINDSDSKAQELINAIFGSSEALWSIIDDILDNNAEYLFNVGGGVGKCKWGSVNVYRENAIRQLSFVYTLIYGIDTYVKSFHVRWTNVQSGYLVINDLLKSDNIRTVTKKTTAEYNAIGTKNNNTMYAVID